MAVTVVPESVLDAQVRVAGELTVSEAPGRAVRELRTRFGYTQEALAALLRMRRESLSRIEGGKALPGTTFIQRFASVAALTRAVREHLAECEARRLAADQAYLQRLAAALRLPREVADEVVLAATLAYEEKKRGLLRSLEESR